MAGLPITNMIAGAAQGTIGIAQMIGGLTMPKPDIPDYDIPDEIYKNMTDAEYWSFQGLPEAQKQQFVENSQRTGAEAMTRSSSRKGGLGMISSIAQQQQDANKGMLVADSQARMQNLRNFWGAREKMASQKVTQQEWKMQKVLDERAKRDEMIGAGMQNFSGSFSTFAGASSGASSTNPMGGGNTMPGGNSYNFGSQDAPTLNMPTMPTTLSS